MKKLNSKPLWTKKDDEMVAVKGGKNDKEGKKAR